MAKQLMTKQRRDEALNKLAVELKIRGLVKLFKRKQNNEIGELYNILSQIVKLKKSINSRYTDRSLEWEEGIKLPSSKIRYIFSYQYFSDKSKQLVAEDKIEDRTICFLIWRFAFLRESMFQNQMVKLYLDGQITISQIGEMCETEIRESLRTGKVVLKEKEKYLISACKTIRALRARLKMRKMSEEDTPYKEKLIREIRILLGSLK